VSQNNLCEGKYRVVHSATPGFKYAANGGNYNMHAYEASDCGGGSHTPIPRPLPTLTPAVTCTWTRKNSFYAQVGHGKCPESDVFADLEAAKQSCIGAGDCKAIVSQNNLCEGKYRVVHSATPGFKYAANGGNYNMHAYEASDCGGG